MGGKNSKPTEAPTDPQNVSNEPAKFENQLAGHEGSILKEGDDKILKLCSKAELHFYQEVYTEYENLRKFAPKFYGTSYRDGKMYLILEDLTHKYQKPCILDIKMGTSSVGEDASPEKKASMKAKDESTTTVSLGIRISGFKVWRPKQEKFVSRDKDWGKEITEQTMLISLSGFFSDGKSVRKPLISAFLTKLLELEEWIEKQTDHRFYSSSLLFVCDGIVEKKGEPQVDIRMIDFAHVFPIKDNGKDEGYLFGLKNLIKFMRALLGEKIKESKTESKAEVKKEEKKSKEMENEKEEVRQEKQEKKEEEKKEEEEEEEEDDDENEKQAEKEVQNEDSKQSGKGQRIEQVKEQLLEEASKTTPTASEKGLQTLSVKAHPGVKKVAPKFEGEGGEKSESSSEVASESGSESSSESS